MCCTIIGFHQNIFAMMKKQLWTRITGRGKAHHFCVKEAMKLLRVPYQYAC